MPKLTKRVVEAIKPSDREVIVWDDELRGFGVRVWPSGKRAYFVKYRTREGRQRKPTIGEHGMITAEQARSEARTWLAEAKLGRDPAELKKKALDLPTMNDLAERYLDKHARRFKKPSSVRNDERMLTKRILPTLGRRRLGEIGRDDIRALHDGLESKPYEANRLLALLSKMFNLAEEWGLRDEGSNPCGRIKKFREKKRGLVLEDDQSRRLLAALDDAERSGRHSPAVVAAIKLLMFTGCRLSEVLTMRWEEVDFRNRLVHLGDSKTGARLVQLNDQAIEILQTLERRPDNPFVIYGHRRGAHLVNLQKPWREIRARAKLDNVRLHDLRHNFGSNCALDGMSLPMIGALMGHKSPLTTTGYAHFVNKSLREGNERVGKRLSGAAQE